MVRRLEDRRAAHDGSFGTRLHLTRVMNIVGIKPLTAATAAWDTRAPASWTDTL
jgi:hypothetical protein